MGRVRRNRGGCLMGPIYCTAGRRHFADDQDHPECDGTYPNPFVSASLTVGDMQAVKRAEMDARMAIGRDVPRLM